MGNRAIIKTADGNIGIYVHWNGGRDSVEGFLEYCRLKGYCSPEKDGYGWARLAQVIGNFFGGTNSIGIVSTGKKTDGDDYGCDNGAYIIKDWKIVGRECYDGPEQHEYPLDEMLLAIDEKQPASEQIGKYLTSREVKTSELKPGDKIVRFDWYGSLKESVIIGIGKPGKVVNGHDVGGIPYIGEYGDEPENNPNNYIYEEVSRISAEPEPEKVSAEIIENQEQNGIEIKFSDKPDAETREKLKENGFKWHSKKKVWYARKTDARAAFAEELAG